MLWAGSASCVHKPKEKCLLLVLKCSFLVHPPHHKTLDSSHFKPNSLHSIQIRGKGSFSNTPKRRVLLVQDSHIHTNYENSELSLNAEKLQSWEADQKQQTINAWLTWASFHPHQMQQCETVFPSITSLLLSPTKDIEEAGSIWYDWKHIIYFSFCFERNCFPQCFP